MRTLLLVIISISIFPFLSLAQVQHKSTNKLTKIKAVLIVGPDGEVAPMMMIASFLRKKGATIKEFYDPSDAWVNIKKALKNANLVIYCGHGKVSSVCLSEYNIVPLDSIIHQIKKNSLVIFTTACESAGSSATDDIDIGVGKAVQRVSDYSLPLVKIRGAYYANNFTDGIIPFLKDFFNKTPIKKAYTSSVPEYCKIETIKKYKYSSDYEIGIESQNPIEPYTTRITGGGIWGPEKIEKIKSHRTYDVAFVAPLNYSIDVLLK